MSAEAERRARAVLAADDPPELRLWKPWALDLADDVLALLADRDRLAGEIGDLRERVGSWVIGGRGDPISIVDVLDELCRILEPAALSDSKEEGE